MTGRAIKRIARALEESKHVEDRRVQVEGEMLEMAVLILKEHAHVTEFLGFTDCASVMQAAVEEIYHDGMINRVHFGMVLERMRDRKPNEAEETP